jgi:hypothetical protein
MIINNFNISRAVLSPNKTKPKLIIYPNAILTLTVAFQGFQPVTGRGAQEIKCLGGI